MVIKKRSVTQNKKPPVVQGLPQDELELKIKNFSERVCGYIV